MNTVKASQNFVSNRLGRSFRTLLVAGAGLAAAIVLTASASASYILSDLGYDDQGWVLFALEGRLRIENSEVEGDIAAGYKANIDITKDSTVDGDVYVYSTKGSLTLKDGSDINGTVYSDGVNKVEVKSGSTIDAQVTTTNTDAMLNTMKQQAITASNNAKNLAANRTISGNKVDMSGGSGGFNALTTGSPALNNTYVLKLTDFKLDQGNDLHPVRERHHEARDQRLKQL